MKSNQTPYMTTVLASELVVRLVALPTPAPSLLVVLCHGYGAPGDDLVGLAAELLRTPALAAVTFAFVQAPLLLDGAPFGGRAWWPIDVSRFANALMSNDPEAVDALHNETPEGLPKARKQLLASVDALTAKMPGVPVVLGGFSQGSMLATDVALRREEVPAGLVVFSGTLLSRAQWTALAVKRNALPIFQSHGTHDPILPYASAQLLQQMLDAPRAGTSSRVQFQAFSGGHTIDGAALNRCATFLCSLIPAATGDA